MTRRRHGRGGSGAPGGVAPVYEGPEVLSALLAQAGSPHRAEEVAERFAAAQANGEPRSDVIPTLFPEEPRFPSPEAARRLYGNLFGLWARLEAGLGPHDDAPAVAAAPPPRLPLPERGSLRGSRLTREIVEAVWTHLADESPRRQRARHDRYVHAQPDLVAWLDAFPLPDSGAPAADDLCYEAWAMFDQAFGDRVRTVDWKELRALEPEPPTVEASQPALAPYVAEQLDTLADDDPYFGPEDRAQVERAVAVATAALTRAVLEPS
ncbi:MAG TPA: hypothetical protein VLS93_14215 [Anaeromyxobacteraceae bacterium]|nr:hypothetical protein [Anaeromyxobacteraceae bacterium]